MRICIISKIIDIVTVSDHAAMILIVSINKSVKTNNRWWLKSLYFYFHIIFPIFFFAWIFFHYLKQVLQLYWWSDFYWFIASLKLVFELQSNRTWLHCFHQRSADPPYRDGVMVKNTEDAKRQRQLSSWMNWQYRPRHRGVFGMCFNVLYVDVATPQCSWC